jgi:hypothetical protein
LHDKHATAPRWATSSFVRDDDSLPMELVTLGEHLTLCQALTGRLFPLRCWADAAHRFVAHRMVTTLVLVCAAIGVGLWLF